MNDHDPQFSKAKLALAHTEYNHSLNLHAYFKTHNKFLSEDLVQETFLKTWSYLVKGGEIVLMKAFLYHVLNNLIIDEYRKKKTTSLDDLLEKGYEPSVGGKEKLLNFLDGSRATELMEKLPKKYREVMKSRYKEEMSLEEISEATGKTKNAIAVQLHRGLAKLKALHTGEE